jgi:hypothetical protein
MTPLQGAPARLPTLANASSAVRRGADVFHFGYFDGMREGCPHLHPIVGGREILPVDGHGVPRWRPGLFPGGGHEISPHVVLFVCRGPPVGGPSPVTLGCV